ncbi:uncharacterized protein CDAR_24611 [Caerostris darwini]|uniref:Uncharacterized protein n=1 Tax=Caerostris darwini TaxID=1538125 RepID=A0AAV4Q995_9ARAC|nr:uncharacterized protein CDAR_24611 [Caerostris darwini]
MSLEKFYKNPKEPASFGGINALRRAVGKQVKNKDIKQWFETKDLYTLHKPTRRNFKKNRVIVGEPPSPITLVGKWEVGLAEIIYPHTWYNVNETNNMFGFDLGDGISFQREYGLGGVFRRLFRAALPFLVRGGKVVGKEDLVTGTKVINDVLSGKDLETAAKNRNKEAGKSLARKAINCVQSMIGQGAYKRKRKNRKRVISSKTRKVSEHDIFD